MASLLPRSKAQRQGRRSGFQPGRFHCAGQQRSRRQVCEHRKPRGELHQQNVWRQAGDPGGSGKRSRESPGDRADRGGSGPRELRRTRIRPRVARCDANRRSHQRSVRRCAAVGAREGSEPARRIADDLLAVAAGLPAVDRAARAGAARDGVARRTRIFPPRTRFRLVGCVERAHRRRTV